MSKRFVVTYSPEAVDDLRAIHDYIRDALSAPQAARGQLGRIRDTIRSLSLMPRRHPLLDWEPWRSMGVRMMNVGNYVVIYRVKEEASEVQIVRVAYGGRNLADLLVSAN